MVKKSKNRRSSASEKYNRKSRVEIEPKKNPFDLHANRSKHDVLGKKRNYERVGQPLKSRERGIEKRKRTLLKEFNSVFKKNTFIDNRLGEKDPTLTSEEKIMQRLIAERSKVRLAKESRYNLNDEEDLTHYGQSLSKSDDLNQRPVIDDYDDEDKGKIGSEHFFGGFQSADGKRRNLTKKEWIEEMIKTTKMDKYERQRENEKVFDLTENLDEQWKALSRLMGIKERKSKEDNSNPDDYDKLVNSLRFEPTAPVSSLKTIEEKRKEEEERRNQLQIEEARRMERPTVKSVLSKVARQNHQSVEELDESYYVMDGSKNRVQFDDEPGELSAEENGDQNQDENNEQNDEENEDQNDEDPPQKNGISLQSDYPEIPSSLEKLQEKLDEDPSALMNISKRINDKRLPAIPRSVLSNYFEVLLDFFQSDKDDQKTLNQIGKRLLQLLQIVNNDQTRSSVIDRLKKIQNEIQNRIENEKYFQIDRPTIFFLKLIGYLYPTSDFRHPITTAAGTILVEIVQHASLSSLNSIREVLLVVDLIKKWNSKNQRFVPEVILLFVKILQLTIPRDKLEVFVFCSSRQVQNGEILLLTEKVENFPEKNFDEKIFFSNEDLDEENQQNRAQLVEFTLNFIFDFIEISGNLPSIVEITKPLLKIISVLKENSLSSRISFLCEKIFDSIKSKNEIERKPLEQGKEEKKPLKLFEPRFGPVFEGKKSNRLSKEFNERIRLRKKYKRDLKSTVRTLTLDNQFISREEIRQQMEKDAQRKRKVKEIQAQLSMQEGEFRKMKKIL